jgi:IS4 transposase
MEAYAYLAQQARKIGVYRHAKKLKKFVVSTDGLFLELNPEVYTYAKQGYCPMVEDVRYGIKVHNALNVGMDEIAPIAFRITTGDVHDTKMFEELEKEVLKLLPKEEVIFVNDLGYFSLDRLQRMCNEGKQFIVPLNPNVKGRKIKIRQKYHGTGFGDYVYRHPKMRDDLRLIVARIGKRKIFLLTNNWRLSPQRIVELYNGRWDSEVFHKEVKRYFSIKKPIGQTWNALVIQILSVFIAYLLLLIFKFLHNHKGSLLETKRIIAEGWWLPASEIVGKPPDTKGL